MFAQINHGGVNLSPDFNNGYIVGPSDVPGLSGIVRHPLTIPDFIWQFGDLTKSVLFRNQKTRYKNENKHDKTCDNGDLYWLHISFHQLYYHCFDSVYTQFLFLCTSVYGSLCGAVSAV